MVYATELLSYQANQNTHLAGKEHQVCCNLGISTHGRCEAAREMLYIDMHVRILVCGTHCVPQEVQSTNPNQTEWTVESRVERHVG